MFIMNVMLITCNIVTIYLYKMFVYCKMTHYTQCQWKNCTSYGIGFRRKHNYVTIYVFLGKVSNAMLTVQRDLRPFRDCSK